MSWLRKQVVPEILQILMLLFVVAFVADDVGLQTASLNVTPNQQLVLYDDTGDHEHHTWNIFTYPSRSEHNLQWLPLVTSNYIDQFNGCHIPSSPSIFFQPDRASPVSFQ